MISISNTGRHISVFVTPDILQTLMSDLNTGRFGIDFRDGMFMFTAPIDGRPKRKFSKASVGKDYYMTLASDTMPDMPTFGIERWGGYILANGIASVPLPPIEKLSPAKPRIHTLRDQVEELVDTVNNVVEAGLDHVQGLSDDLAALYRRGSWKTPEAFMSSMRGLEKARATRAAKAATKRARKAEKAKQQPTSQPFTPRAFTPTKRTVSSANVVVAAGSKSYTFNVPEDELLDFVVDLSERGYRVKEDA